MDDIDRARFKARECVETNERYRANDERTESGRRGREGKKKRKEEERRRRDASDGKARAEERAEERVEDATEILNVNEHAREEELKRMSESLRDAEKRGKALAERAVEFEERLRALSEENASEARALARAEAQLKRREREFEQRKENLTRELEEAIAIANERDKEAMGKAREAREEIARAKVAASEYELDDARVREFSLKAGWCARYLHRAIDLKAIKANEDAGEEARFWTRAFGIAASENDTHASIAKRIDDAIVEDARRPRLSFKCNPASSARESTPSMTSLPPSRNPSWPKNFRDAVRVELAMRQIIADRVEERVAVALADARRSRALATVSLVPAQIDASALSKEEIDEFHFRRAWLRLMWARAREANIFVGLSDEREDYWCDEMEMLTDLGMEDQSRFKRDAVAVDKGLKELRTLFVETRLWRT